MLSHEEIKEINDKVRRLARELDQIQSDFEGMSDEDVPGHLEKAITTRRKLNIAMRKRGQLT